MTRRERVLKAISFEQTDFVPYSIGLTIPLHEQVARHFGTPNVDDALGNHLYVVCTNPPPLWSQVKPGFRRDAFGVVWDRTVDEDIGTTTADLVLPEPTLRGYSWPDPLDKRRFQQLDSAAQTAGDRFVAANFGFSLFERAWTMRGMENLLMDMIANEDFADQLFDAICRWNLQALENIVKYPVDAVFFGDDWGSQRGLIMGPKLWRRFIKPHLAKMYKAVRDSGKIVMIHSCGGVDELFDELVDLGVSLFNPFQPEVMDTFEIAARFKGRLAFFGGISTQRLLPYGTPDQVRSGVREILTRIGAGGGYIAAPAHDTPKDVPLENVIAMWEVLSGKSKR